MIRAILFDRDGTLTEDKGYTFRPEALRFLPGAVDAVRAVNQAGWLAIIVTNQSGVARGIFTEADVWRFHAEMQARLAAAGAWIDAYYYCPFLAGASVAAYADPDPPDRKPNPGMILRAIADFGLNPAGCAVVGDQPSDVEAAKRAGVSGFLVTPQADVQQIVASILASAG
jgi:D-glycero-D-manno-heptose 1,7-bisphosphate phosphatase